MNFTEFKGYVGEFLAGIILRCKGFSIIARRYKTRCGEIDIVAKKGNLLVFAEVKARKSGEKCFVAITAKQMQRVQNASKIFISQHPQYAGFFCRYDVILAADWEIPLHVENITM